MAPASNEEQFKFLISCIRYSNNGKVDFGQVAKECRIVSKGAAAKRYERMMRSHGIAPNAASVKPAPIRIMKTERGGSSSPSPATSKKRKADAFLDENTADDDEGFGSIKVEQGGMKEQFVVKEEGGHQGALSLGEAANLMQYYDPPSSYGSAQLGVDIGYNGGNYGDRAGYSTTIGPPLSMQAPQPYNYSSPYSSGMGAVPRSEAQNLHYQPMMQYQGEEQGHSDSPLVVE